MDNIKTYRNKKTTLVIITSIVFSILIFNFLFGQKDKKIKEFAIDKETKFVNEQLDGKEIICNVRVPLKNCLNKDFKNNILLLGNSQLNGINQKKNKDYLASYYLINKFNQVDKNLITFALPNGSITEFLILIEYLNQKIKIDKLVISLVFDDLREGKVRPDLASLFDNLDFKNKFNKSENRKKIIKKITNQNDVVKNYESDESIQDKVEKKINNFLNSCCNYENKKKFATNRIYHNLYLLRNYIFKIDPSSERKMIPSFYQDNIKSLKEIINISKENNINLYFYIAPIRQDIKLPYDMNEYNNFLNFSKNISDSYNINYKNLEKIIPNNLWGTKPGTSIERKKEVDFMHFQGPAHKILSSNIYNFLQN